MGDKEWGLEYHSNESPSQDTVPEQPERQHLPWVRLP